MAGSADWAASRALCAEAADAAMLDAARRLLTAAKQRQLRFVTLCPDDQVASLADRAVKLDRLAQGLRSDIAELAAHGISVQLVGRTGRQDLVEATRALATQIAARRGRRPSSAAAAGRDREVDLDGEFDLDQLRPFLSPVEAPPPDLLILCGRRHSQRLTEYLLFASAYAEFHFSPCRFPDFTAADLDLALADFAQRQRRFGKTAEQLPPAQPEPREAAPAPAPPRPALAELPTAANRRQRASALSP
jgi:undecaprenyl diphosphate synthase